MHVDISGVSGGGVPGKGAQHGKIQIELHVQILEVKNHNSEGGTNATPMMRPM